MEYIRIAIATDDMFYGEALSRALLIENRNFQLTLLGCEKFCLAWQQGGEAYRKGFDLVLWDQEGLEKIYGGNLVWLTDRQVGAEKEIGGACIRDGGDGGRFQIYKYSPSQVIAARIYEIFRELTGRHPAGMRPDHVDIFAFASWQGGCGCTSIAMAVGQELARFENKRVLYLSAEGMESAPQYMEAGSDPTDIDDPQESAPRYMESGPHNMESGRSGKTAGEYLYHLSSDGWQKAPFLEEYLIRDEYGLESFAPSSGCNPLSGAGKEEIDLLMTALLRSGRFDCILIDAGNGTGEPVRCLLPYADRVCLISGREDAARESHYYNFLRHGVGIDAEEKGILVYNRNDRDGFEMAGRVRRKITVSGMEHVPAGSLLEGSFGKDIHKLTELCYN